MDKLRALSHFVACAEAGSFSGAARRLELSVPSVHKLVTALEKSLGIRLFQRSSRGLTLTASGETYLEACRPLLAELVKQPVLSQLDGLTVQLRTRDELDDEAARLIATSPYLRNIRGLVTAFDIGEAGAAALASSENFGKLERFAPDAGYLTEAAIRSLGAAGWFKNLR